MYPLIRQASVPDFAGASDRASSEAWTGRARPVLRLQVSQPLHCTARRSRAIDRRSLPLVVSTRLRPRCLQLTSLSGGPRPRGWDDTRWIAKKPDYPLEFATLPIRARVLRGQASARLLGGRPFSPGMQRAEVSSHPGSMKNEDSADAGVFGESVLWPRRG